jgi:hypothetical protein
VVDELKLTQEFIAEMLGTRRSGVSEAAMMLQEAGLIRYSRGHITILDREGLEEFTCECYATVKVASDRLLGPIEFCSVQGGVPSGAAPVGC